MSREKSVEGKCRGGFYHREKCQEGEVECVTWRNAMEGKCPQGNMRPYHGRLPCLTQCRESLGTDALCSSFYHFDLYLHYFFHLLCTFALFGIKIFFFVLIPCERYMLNRAGFRFISL